MLFLTYIKAARTNWVFTGLNLQSMVKSYIVVPLFIIIILLVLRRPEQTLKPNLILLNSNPNSSQTNSPQA